MHAMTISLEEGWGGRCRSWPWLEPPRSLADLKARTTDWLGLGLRLGLGLG